ncbi:MAG: DUF4232 domain-containing protein [Gemmatimonadota bacterium]
MTRNPRAVRRAIAAAALTCLTALVSACGGGTPVPTKTVTVSASAAASAVASVSPAASAPSPSSPAAPAGPGPCATRDLQVKLGLAQGAAGSIYQVIDFTNIGTGTCSLYGYPGVSLAGGTPVSQIGLAAKEDPSTPRQLVTLAPGAVGNALLRLVQAGFFPPAKCAPVNSRFLQIYPPNQTTPVYLSYKAQTCSKPIQQLTISVVKPGSGG